MGAVVFVAIVFGLLAGFGGMLLAVWAGQQGYLAHVPWLQSGAVPGTASVTRIVQSGSPHQTFAAVADVLDESVVNINTSAHQENPFSWFGGGSQEVKGIGTGVITSADGYILTNFHVVGEADNITVTVMHRNGKKLYEAKFIGGDKQEDLAVIKINARGLQPVRFGNSSALRPGEWVMAIGNPFGFEHTVSVGVVSALNRELPVDDTVTLKGMIQTDASINPGNSGGPLVNLNGEVVGINSAVFVGNGQGPQANSLGFSIPSNHAVKIMQQLREHRRVAHPYIGVVYAELDNELRQQHHIPVKDGMFVINVLRQGPAGKAGILPGDVMVKANGQVLRDKETLGDIIRQRGVGQTIDLELQRWDNAASTWVPKKAKVKIEDKPADAERQMRRMQENQQGGMEQPSPQDNQGGFPFPFPF